MEEVQLVAYSNKFTMNGKDYLILHHLWDTNVYSDQYAYVRDNFIGRAIKGVFNFIERNLQWVIRYDRDSLNLIEGQLYPKHSGTYWLLFPYRITGKFAKRIDGWTLGKRCS